MLTIYHRRRARSIRLIWAVEELGAPYQLVIEDWRKLTPEFVALNPGKTFPLMIDGDLRLTESAAALLYLGDRYGPSPLAVAQGDAAYPLYVQDIIFGEASLAAFLTPVVATKFFAPEDEKRNWTMEQCKRFYADRLRRIEARLEQSPYLMGDNFTLADVSVGYALGMGQALHLTDLFGPKTQDYWTRIRARPAAGKAYAAAT